MMSINKILIVDDEFLIRQFLKDTLEKKFDITLAENGSEAIELLKKESFDLVITDYKMPIKTGLDVLKFIKEKDPSTVVIMMSAFGSIENAVQAIKLGAFNYLIKPFSPESIETMIEKIIKNQKIIKENQYLREATSPFPNIIASSKEMKDLLKNIEKIAKSDASIFISGESGTGKEVIAHLVHYLSKRAKRPFIKVNCAAISSNLIESEFFGHNKGSFTGADQTRVGRFELADGGTLLLDEVTEIPNTLQPKLLRALQEREFERVGGTRPIKVDVRFISTSNRDMKEAISSGIFREDLFFRLNVLPINIPPLRERRDDIIPLANHFLKYFSKKNLKNIKTLSKEAEEKLFSYSWPGNVRELANIIERVVVLDLGEEIKDNNLHLENLKDIPEDGLSLYEVEKKYILKMLKKNNSNKTKTAKILKISIKTLRNKLRDYKIG